MAIDTDAFSRIAKLEVDDGRAATFEEAEALLRTYRIHAVVGADAANSEAWQAGLLTAVNTAHRAALGGMTAVLEDDPLVRCAWGRGMRLSAAVEHFGGRVAPSEGPPVPTLVLGEPELAARVDTPLYLAAGRWTAHVGPNRRGMSSGPTPLSASLAGALAVSEAFQRLRGYVVAADRDVAISLWDPGDPACPDGPPVLELPASACLLGLGHLGQAYAWILGLLPYADGPAVLLQDDDRISAANKPTSMLVIDAVVGERKTRTVAAELERLGFETALVERRHEGGALVGSHDPKLGLIGVDNPQARFTLDEAGFSLVYDAGLGAGPGGYLDMTVRRLPGSRPASELWPPSTPQRRVADDELEAYRELRRQTGDACGVVELQQRTVATAFVGTVAACLVVGSVLRELRGGAAFDHIDLALRRPAAIEAIRLRGVEAPRLATRRAREE